MYHRLQILASLTHQFPPNGPRLTSTFIRGLGFRSIVADDSTARWIWNEKRPSLPVNVAMPSGMQVTWTYSRLLGEVPPNRIGPGLLATTALVLNYHQRTAEPQLDACVVPVNRWITTDGREWSVVLLAGDLPCVTPQLFPLSGAYCGLQDPKALLDDLPDDVEALGAAVVRRIRTRVPEEVQRPLIQVDKVRCRHTMLQKWDVVVLN